MQIFEESLAIVESAERVGYQDHVERTRQRLDEGFIFDVSGDERKMRMKLSRLLDHSTAEIHADAKRRLEGGQKMPRAATQLQQPRALRDEKSQIGQVLFVKESGATKPLLAGGRHAVRQRTRGLLTRRHRASGRRFDLDLHLSFNHEQAVH